MHMLDLNLVAFVWQYGLILHRTAAPQIATPQVKHVI